MLVRNDFRTIDRAKPVSGSRDAPRPPAMRGATAPTPTVPALDGTPSCNGRPARSDRPNRRATRSDRSVLYLRVAANLTRAAELSVKHAGPPPTKPRLACRHD